MFPEKKIKVKNDDFIKQEPYHSNSNLLSQTIQWINFINSEKNMMRKLWNSLKTQKLKKKYRIN